MLVATFSPALRPVLISTRSIDGLADGDDAFLGSLTGHDIDARSARDRAHGRRRDENTRTLRGLFDSGRRERARLESSRVVRDERFDDERSRIGLEGGRHVAHLTFEPLAGRGIDLE